MSKINSFATSGVWNYRNIIVPGSIAIPLAIEGALFAKNMYQHPEAAREKLAAWQKTAIQSFTIQPEETRKEGIFRIAKNVFYLLSCLALMGGSAYFSVLLLPKGIAIACAISSIFLIGKLFANGSSYKKELIAAFTQQEGEGAEEAKKRIRTNFLKGAALLIGAIGAIAIGAHILIPMVSHGFSWSVSLPLQTKGVVFAEYGTVGMIHGGLSYRKWKQGDYLGAFFHLFAAALSFLFPVHYWNGQMRLHHSFYGLLLMAAPSRPLQFFGTLATLDSALYLLAPWRGYTMPGPYPTGGAHQYDFINSVVDNYSLFGTGYAASLMAENINRNWTEKKRSN